MEVGGIKPFALTLPPDSLFQGILQAHFNFITAAAAYHPDVEWIDIKLEKLDKNLYRISARIHNKGVFATINELGARNSWVRMMTVELDSDSDLEIISGQKRTITGRLKGDESRDFTWLVRGKGMVTLKAGAVNCGFDKASLELK